VFSAQIFQENTFLKTKPNFPLTGKCFLLTNFFNDKQTQESLESDFPETTFRKTNTAKRENTFLETKPNFSLTEKCFLLTGKYFPLTRKCFRWLENVFRWPTFLMANKYRKVRKIISRKVNSEKQTWLSALWVPSPCSSWVYWLVFPSLSSLVRLSFFFSFFFFFSFSGKPSSTLHKLTRSCVFTCNIQTSYETNKLMVEA